MADILNVCPGLYLVPPEPLAVVYQWENILPDGGVKEFDATVTVLPLATLLLILLLELPFEV